MRYGLLRNKIIVLHSVPCRPPQLRCAVFPSIYLPHLLSISSDSYWASVCLATLPDIPSLICDFCSSDQRFAIRLPSDSTSRWTPLPLAVSFPLSGHFTDFHRLDYAHAGRTKKKHRSFLRCFLIYFLILYYSADFFVFEAASAMPRAAALITANTIAVALLFSPVL